MSEVIEDVISSAGTLRSAQEVMGDTRQWYNTAAAAEFFPGKNGRPCKSDQWIHWCMRNGRFTYPENTPLQIGDPVVHVCWRIDGKFNPRTKRVESVPVKGTVIGLLSNTGAYIESSWSLSGPSGVIPVFEGKVSVEWENVSPADYPTSVDLSEVLKLIVPLRIGKAGYLRFSLPMIQDIALSWHQQGNFSQDDVRVVLKRIELASRGENYRGVF